MNDALARPRLATRVQFAVLGVLAGAWGVHVPSAKATYALEARALGAALLCSSLGAFTTLFFAGRIVAKLGARGASVVGGLLMTAVLASVLVLPTPWLLFPLMMLLGAGESIFDIAINAEAAVLERESRRPLMTGFHAMFSVGAMAGSALAAALLRAEVPARVQLGAIGAALAITGVVASRGMLAVHPSDDEPKAHFTWPHGMLLAIGLLIAVGLLAEGAMYNGSVRYVQQELHAPQARAALAYVTFAGAMAAMRFVGDTLRRRFPERTILIASGTLATVSLAVVLLIGNATVAIAGFAVTGIALATVVPILYLSATRVPGISSAAAIASVSSMGALGMMAGPPLVGTIAQVTSLTVAMWAVVLSSAVLAVGAVLLQSPKAA